MDRERFQRLQELFDQAMELPSDRRRQFLERACENDPKLLRHVLGLLEMGPEDEKPLEEIAGAPSRVERRIGRPDLQDRAHFCALAARTMRFILVDHARAESAAKRGGKREPVTLQPKHLAARDRAADLVDLDRALDRLSSADERLARIVEYHFFGGMTCEEIATVTGQSIRTVKRDWSRARAWLHRLMDVGAGTT